MSEEPSSNFTSEDFDRLGKDKLLKLFEKRKIGMFYHAVQRGKVWIPEFQPALLSAYFRIVYHVKTIEPSNPKYYGDMYYYDYDSETYLPNAEIFFDQLIKSWWKDKYLEIKESLVFKDLRASTYIDRRDFELDLNYIPVSNGILKLEKNDKWTYRFIPNSPEYFVIVRISTRYDPEAKCVKFLKQLNDCLPDKRLEQTWLKQWTGDCLRRKQEFDRALIAVGDGDNGKTTIFDVIRAMLGKENTIEMSLHTLTNNRFAAADLDHKLALIGDDLSPRDLRDTSEFLKITGGSSQLRAERKNRDAYQFEPTLKCGWPANLLPHTPDESHAFMRRWLPILFDVTFTNDPNRKAQILSSLTTPEELSGVLNWALEGLLDLLNNDGYTNPPGPDANRSLWRSRSGNAVVRYLYSPDVERKPDGLYLMTQFIEDVTRYALSNNIPTMTAQKIGRTISQTFPEIFKERRKYNGKQVWFYKGIGKKGQEYLLDTEDIEEDDFFE